MNRVLVVDDEEAIRILYDDELSEEGYEVITCGDGSKVLSHIEKNRPDVVVMDGRTGKYDGLELLHDIRNNFYDLPVILCSYYFVFKKDHGSIPADYYVIKSHDLTDLKVRIKTAIQGEEGVIGGTEKSATKWIEKKNFWRR